MRNDVTLPWILISSSIFTRLHHRSSSVFTFFNGITMNPTWQQTKLETLQDCYTELELSQEKIDIMEASV
jgi:hypothetical protein